MRQTILITATVACSAVIVAYYLWQKIEGDAVVYKTPTVSETVVSKTKPPKPQIVTEITPPIVSDELPIYRSQDEEEIVDYEPIPETPVERLPLLDKSDEAVENAAQGFSGLAKLLRFGSFIRHFVVTVDNMKNEKLPQRYRFTQRVTGKFAVNGKDDLMFLSEENYQRYSIWVRVFIDLDSNGLLTYYQRFYPLLQQAYEDLGYPDRRFHDRLIEVLEDLLKTPDVTRPIRLIRPKVFYLFADSELESLNAGQKIMLRIGADNRLKVKVKLRELNTMLLGLDP